MATPLRLPPLGLGERTARAPVKLPVWEQIEHHTDHEHESAFRAAYAAARKSAMYCHPVYMPLAYPSSVVAPARSTSGPFVSSPVARQNVGATLPPADTAAVGALAHPAAVHSALAHVPAHSPLVVRPPIADHTAAVEPPPMRLPCAPQTLRHVPSSPEFEQPYQLHQHSSLPEPGPPRSRAAPIDGAAHALGEHHTPQHDARRGQRVGCRLGEPPTERVHERGHTGLWAPAPVGRLCGCGWGQREHKR
ncbi:hypothetical protein B0H17DRAFT_1214712 [Mycena rosella]|uniref:Uncharacterized protein n=1 Tax=Mycena rosella TaxID=1033263 RepID=A0AAD7G3R5_MYCRO|nr:hypothetical protein B0H17DRAFT_1214712 [Mycena rosella]